MSENPLTNGMGWVAATLLTEDTERVNRSTEQPEEMAGDILGRMGLDALAWAEQFRKISVGLSLEDRLDIGYLVGWFANAIEAGRHAGRQETCPHIFDRLMFSGPLVLCLDCAKVLVPESGPTLPEVAPELVTTLGQLFDEYGPLGVVQVAQKMQAGG